MPLYEYKCRSCGKTFEVIAKFSDDPLKTHAECGGEVDRLFSAPAFHLKGTGWYATDYAKKNGSDTKPAESKPKADGDKTETKASTESSTPAAESKPAAPASSESTSKTSKTE